MIGWLYRLVLGKTGHVQKWLFTALLESAQATQKENEQLRGRIEQLEKDVDYLENALVFRSAQPSIPSVQQERRDKIATNFACRRGEAQIEVDRS